MTENEVIKYFRLATDEAGNEEFSDDYKEMCSMAIQALTEIQAYRAIGTVEECRTAVERMKPKKVTYQGEHEKCPSCGSFHVFGKHCTECGQAVDYD